MTKNELADQVASSTGLPASQAREALEAAITARTKLLVALGLVLLVSSTLVIGYGNYTSYQYPAGLDLEQISAPPPPPPNVPALPGLGC